MNNLRTNFDQIVEFARMQSVPITKLRAIAREYLQTKLLVSIYSQPSASKLSLIGGSGLRLLRNLDRFSEDLDFDNLGLLDAEVSGLVQGAMKNFLEENYKVELVVKPSEAKSNYELRFPDLLFELGITPNPKEKLKIKIDYSNLWRGQSPETILLNKYGMLEIIITNPLNQQIVQKLTAYVKRSETQPRDLYDVVWLYSQGARLDREFMHQNNLVDLLDQAKQKLVKEGIPAKYSLRLNPFLFDEKKIRWLTMFADVIHHL